MRLKQGDDVFVEVSGITLVHQKIPGRHLDTHLHAQHEFFVPLQGEITLELAGATRLNAGPGRLLYVPPHQAHRFTSVQSGEGERLILLVSQRRWLGCGGKRNAPTLLPMIALARELMFYVLLHPRHPNVNVFVEALVMTLVQYLPAAQAPRFHITDGTISRAVVLLREGFSLPIPQLAKQLGLSPRNFNRRFFDAVGVSPKAFQVRVNMERAEHFLLRTNLTVTDVALECGYQSLSKFIAMFQKYSGQLPSEFRRSQSDAARTRL